jgi:hypothetical protein
MKWAALHFLDFRSKQSLELTEPHLECASVRSFRGSSNTSNDVWCAGSRVRQYRGVSTYFLCDPLAVLPSPEGQVPSPWQVLIEIPSDQPDRFMSTLQLVSLEALRQRLGDGFYLEARRLVLGQPPRLAPIERQDNIREEELGQEQGAWNTFRYWFTDRLKRDAGNDPWF